MGLRPSAASLRSPQTVTVGALLCYPVGTNLRGGRMRYRKNAMIVAAQPESTEAGAEILKAGGNAVDAAMACALVQGVVDPLMCGIAGFGSCGIAMPGEGLPRLHRLPRARAARRPPRHVGRPDRVGGARRLRLHPARARERHRLPVDLRAREPAGLPRRPPRARAPAVGADRGAGDRLGGRAAGRCGPTWRTGGRTRDRWAARRAPSAWRSRRPAGRSTAVPTARPSAWATAW